MVGRPRRARLRVVRDTGLHAVSSLFGWTGLLTMDAESEARNECRRLLSVTGGIRKGGPDGAVGREGLNCRCFLVRMSSRQGLGVLTLLGLRTCKILHEARLQPVSS